MRHELPETVRISRVINEAEGLVSLILPVHLKARPGQFVMLWLPGVDAKPVGISYWSGEELGVTVSAVGKWSKQVCALKENDLIGVLGPYGNGFKVRGDRVVLIGGGYGTASLMTLAEELKAKEIKQTLIVGARSERYLLYRERIAKLGIDAVYSTDDGSFGEKGYNTEVLKSLLDKERVDTIYCCGPELMERQVALIATESNVPAQISLERHMKCGFGVCGACCMDESGERACVEGPVYSAEKAMSFKEFGVFHRDGAAHKHYL